MKTLVYLFTITLLIFAGCAKDEIFDNNTSTPELKNAKVPIPMKADLYAVPDMDSPTIPVLGDPNNLIQSIMNIHGTLPHLGRLNSEESYYEIDDLYLNSENVPEEVGQGFLIGANGDCLEFNYVATSTSPHSYIGTIEFTGGTGKFEGCSGTGLMAGSFDDARINHFTVEGTLEFD